MIPKTSSPLDHFLSHLPPTGLLFLGKQGSRLANIQPKNRSGELILKSSSSSPSLKEKKLQKVRSLDLPEKNKMSITQLPLDILNFIAIQLDLVAFFCFRRACKYFNAQLKFEAYLRDYPQQKIEHIISLNKSIFSDSSFKVLMQAGEKNLNFQKLPLDSQHILNNFLKLKSLHLKIGKITFFLFENLIELSKKGGLEELTLESQDSTSKVTFSLKTVARNPKIKKLCLRPCAEKLLQQIKAPFESITKLEVDFLSDSQFVFNLQFFVNLQHLTLFAPNFYLNSFDLIFAKLPRLQFLTLKGHSYNATEIGFLADAKALKCLTVELCELNQQVLDALKKVTGLSELEQLNLTIQVSPIPSQPAYEENIRLIDCFMNLPHLNQLQIHYTFTEEMSNSWNDAQLSYIKRIISAKPNTSNLLQIKAN